MPGHGQDPTQTGEPFPLSFEQQSLWHREVLADSPGLVNAQAALRIHGSLDHTALQAACASLIERHDALRTTFTVTDGIVWQQELTGVPVDFGVAAVADDAAVRRAVHDELVHPFRLESGPLVKFRLYRLAADHHIFLVIVHHLIADATSIAIMQADLAELYLAASGGRLPEPAPGLRYREFVAEQRADADAAWRDELGGYWASAFAGLPDLSYRPPEGRNDGLGPVVRARVATQVAEAVAGFSRAAQVTEFVVLVSAVRLLLWRVTGGDDVLIAVPASGRDYPGTENTVGLFLSTLMLRNALAGKTTFGELVAAEWVTFLAALDHKDTPYQEMLMAARSDGMTDLPPAAATFSYRLADRGLPTAPGLEISDFEFGETSLPSGLVVETIRDSAGYEVFVGYDDGLFARPAVADLATRLPAFLAVAVASPDTPLAEFPWP